MNNWWKNPVLQGPENDYGQYDYLIEDIPESKEEWSRWYKKCDECGKYHYLNLTYTAYFHTLDGWDSMDSCECWVCYLKGELSKPFRKLNRKIKKFIKMEKEMRHIKKMCKEHNVKLTKEFKNHYRKILNMEA